VRANPPYEGALHHLLRNGNEFSTPFPDGQILYALGANNTPSAIRANPR